jgi:tetratricopeptide (TPR) repeat protein
MPHLRSRSWIVLAGLFLVAAAPTDLAAKSKTKHRRIFVIEDAGCAGPIPYPNLIVVLGKPTFVRTPGAQRTPEDWFRLGERDFEMAADPRAGNTACMRAIEELTHAAEAKGFANRSLAAYHLAWTTFHTWSRDYRETLEKAAAGFVRILNDCPECNGPVPGNVRKESLASLAATLAEPEFGGMERACDFLKEQGSREWVLAAWMAFADTLLDIFHLHEAITAYRQALLLDPWATSAPRAQAGIVRALERKPAATEERKILLEAYGPGSAWHNHNRGNAEALANAKEILDKAQLPEPRWRLPWCNQRILHPSLMKLRDAAMKCTGHESFVRKVVLHAAIASDGRFQAVRTDESGPLADCVLDVARGLQLDLREECLLDVTVAFAAQEKVSLGDGGSLP